MAVDTNSGRCMVSAADARILLGRYAAARERNRDDFGDCEGRFQDVGGEGYRGRLRCLDVGGVRISHVLSHGSLRMDGAWHDDTLAAGFAWSTGSAADGSLPATPKLLVWGPGSALRIRLRGTSCNLRIGVRGPALAAALADPRLEPARRHWLRPELMRPRVEPAVEWRLQRRILATTHFAAAVVERAVAAERALAVAAAEVVAALVATLAAAGPDRQGRSDAPKSRQRLVQAAVARMESEPGEPLSLGLLCRELGTSQRSLHRAFDEVLGISPRGYERERRLRGVHGAILAEGDRRSVTDIAMSFGFWHLSRFAGAYAASYGCAPSETRRRVWGRDVVGASTEYTACATSAM